MQARPVIDRFPRTRWSMVLRAKGLDPDAAQRGLGELCRDYRGPLLAYARRRAGPAEAEDLVQGFLVSLLRPGAIANASAAEGRFRAYLLGAFRNFIANEALGRRRAKRGGGVAPISAASLGDERWADDSPAADEVFDAAWALAVLRRAELALRREYEERGHPALFEALFGSLHDVSPQGYAGLAGQVGMREGALRVAIHRMRRRLGDHLRREVAQTLVDPDSVERELQALIDTIRRQKIV